MKIITSLNEYLNQQLLNNIENDNFIKWFGNSIVVDKNNNPLVVYHGSKNIFNVFDKNKFNLNEPSGDYIGCGFYFTTNKSKAMKYGSNIISAYLKIKNPLVINDYKEFENMMIDIFGYDEKHKNIPKYT